MRALVAGRNVAVFFHIAKAGGSSINSLFRKEGAEVANYPVALALTLAPTLASALTVLNPNPNPDPNPNPNPNQLVNYLGFRCFAWIFGAFFGAAAWSKCLALSGQCPSSVPAPPHGAPGGPLGSSALP